MTTRKTRVPITNRVLDAFPAGTYALHALLQVLEIVESEEVPTAATECRIQPRMLINPTFVEAHANTPEKLLMLVMHELHHVLLGHTRLFPRATKVDNLVFDAVINALLCRMFPEPEHTRFFTDFYDDASFPACLLRPPAGWTPEDQKRRCPPALAPRSKAKARKVYAQLYSKTGASYHDLYEILKDNLSEEQASGVPLLGGHEHDRDGEAEQPEPDVRQDLPLLYDAVRRIVEEWPDPPEPVAGRSLGELAPRERVVVQIERTNRQLLRSLFRKVTGNAVGNSPLRDWRESRQTIQSPIPGFQRRSVVLALIGAKPLLHEASIQVRSWLPGSERVHVYLDVSGSIGDLKGALYGAVLDCADIVHPQVHLFSTVVIDVSLERLRRGDCPTTGGTNIECVAQHMKENRVKRAVIITDGFTGRPSGELATTLQAATLGIALTPGQSRRDDLAPFANHWVQLNPPVQRTK